MKRIGVVCFLFLLACKGNTPQSTAEVIQKNWVVNLVRENNAVVFSKGVATNIRPGYSNFRLSLNAANSATLTEFDNTSFSGQWGLSGDTKTLVLRDLSPQPTGTSGKIEYGITFVNESSLVLSRITTNSKTGAATNTYELIPQ